MVSEFVLGQAQMTPQDHFLQPSKTYTKSTILNFNQTFTPDDKVYYLKQSSHQSFFAVKSAMHITNTIARQQNHEAFATEKKFFYSFLFILMLL